MKEKKTRKQPGPPRDPAALNRPGPGLGRVPPRMAMAANGGRPANPKGIRRGGGGGIRVRRGDPAVGSHCVGWCFVWLTAG